MNAKILFLGVALAATSLSMAQTKNFSVVGERLEYRNLGTVESESDFETFTGKTTKISGSINFDPKTRKGNGILVVDVASVKTGIDLRDEHMRGAQWMNADKFPTIRFATTSVKQLRGNQYEVTGSITMRGITKAVKGKATLLYSPASSRNKAAGFDGDLVKLNAKVDIRLSDFGIEIPVEAQGKVSNTVTIGISAYALSK